MESEEIVGGCLKLQAATHLALIHSARRKPTQHSAVGGGAIFRKIRYMTKHLTPPPKPLVKALRHLRNIDGPVPVVSLELQFRDSHGKRCTIRIPNSLIDRPPKILEALRSAGARLPAGDVAMKIIKQALNPVFDQVNPLPSIDRTSRNGWHKKSFVLPGETRGEKKGQLELEEPIVTETDDSSDSKENAARLVLSKAGTLDGWKSALERPCALSSVLTFAIAASFAAPLLPFSRLQEAAIFLFAGISGSGKTLSSRAALSVFRRAGKGLADFNQTDTALEEFCAAHNHMLVVVDDTGTAGKSQVELDRWLSKLAYTVTSGKGKQRSSKVQSQGLPNLTFRNLVLASSEESLQKADIKQKRRIGEEVRLIEIPVPRPELGGIFYRANSTSHDITADHKRLCEATSKAIEVNYGVALRPYIDALIADYDQLSGIVEKMTRDFMADAGVGSGSAENRIAQKFALVCVGGRLAAQYGVAPWDEKRVMTACKILFKRTMKLYGCDQPKPMTTAAFARTLCGKVDSSPKNFPRVEKLGALPTSLPDEALLGIRRTMTGTDCLLIPKDRLVALIGASKVPGDVIMALKKAGALPYAGANSATTQVSVKGWPGQADRPSFYIFPLDKLRLIASRPTN